MKCNEYTARSVDSYFWRTYDRKEIDLVEEYEGGLHGYEIKWSDRPVRAPKDWSNNYPNAMFQVINQQNYLPFVTS